MTKRLLIFLNQLDIDQKKIASEIKVSPATISDIANEKIIAGWKVVRNTLLRYPELSAEWLIRGEGNMIRKNEPNSVSFFEEPSIAYLTKQDLYNFHKLVEKVSELEQIVIELQKNIKV